MSQVTIPLPYCLPPPSQSRLREVPFAAAAKREQGSDCWEAAVSTIVEAGRQAGRQAGSRCVATNSVKCMSKLDLTQFLAQGLLRQVKKERKIERKNPEWMQPFLFFTMRLNIATANCIRSTRRVSRSQFSLLMPFRSPCNLDILHACSSGRGKFKRTKTTTTTTTEKGEVSSLPRFF